MGDWEGILHKKVEEGVIAGEIMEAGGCHDR